MQDNKLQLEQLANPPMNSEELGFYSFQLDKPRSLKFGASYFGGELNDGRVSFNFKKKTVLSW